MAPVRATIEVIEVLGLVLVLVAVDEPIAIRSEGDVSFGVWKYFLRSQLPDDELSIDVVDDLASIHGSNHAIAIVPLGVAAEKVLQSSQSRSVGIDDEWRIDAGMFSILAPASAGEKEELGAFAIPKGVVDEKRQMVDVGLGLVDLRRHLLERNEQSVFAGSGIDDENTIVAWVQVADRPVEGVFVSGYRPPAGHASVVDGRERASVLSDAAIAHRIGVEVVFVDALSLPDVVQDGENFSGSGVPVIEEELGIGLFWVPVEHGTLLGVPALSLLDDFNRVVVLRIDENDIGGFAFAGKVVLESGLKGEDVAFGLIPGNRLHMADVAEEGVLGSTCDLGDL